jgi:glycosyltransferase involved in cell wall biosynthesis
MEHPIAVIIPSYNNSKNYQKNLNSIFLQDYQNYRVLYFDDASTDDTYNLVLKYLDNFPLAKQKTTVFHSIKNSKQSCHKFIASRLCHDEEIMVFVDGDDWLKHPNVFKILNSAYQSPSKPWVTYGNYEIYEGYRKPIVYSTQCKAVSKNVVMNNSYRYGRFYTSHLRTCYAWLYKQIPISYLTDFNGKFLPYSTDLAEMRALIELAGLRNTFIKQILYVYNTSNSKLYSSYSIRRKDNPESIRINSYIRNYMIPLKPLTNPILLGINLNQSLLELVPQIIINPNLDEINQLDQGKFYYIGNDNGTDNKHSSEEMFEIGLRYMINLGIEEFLFKIKSNPKEYNVVESNHMIVCLLKDRLKEEDWEGGMIKMKDGRENVSKKGDKEFVLGIYK